MGQPKTRVWNSLLCLLQTLPLLYDMKYVLLHVVVTLRNDTVLTCQCTVTGHCKDLNMIRILTIVYAVEKR